MDKPEHFGAAGSAFWDDINDPDLNLILRADEYRLLVQACETLDLLDVLAEEFAKEPDYIVKGSTGQPVVNPLIAHRDKLMARYQSLVKQLMIPDLDDVRAQQRADQVSGNMSALGRASWRARSGAAG
ncbi:hypothetical protein [Pseudonocardia sp. NPDC046786]|uniref:hypothetical protein n=1 Tax=Pseudonocardia sp. NPDC046786 TaxID=3155471 RepID=UPI0033D53FB8